tara:strand:+ start:49492 stop:51192 length:1701 start_codon:yes stop_codon:yes gene_type:complete
MFAAFILLCGFTHLFGVWVVWNPDYIEQGFLKLSTALASVATAIVIWRIIPVLKLLPSAGQLKLANNALEAEVSIRREKERELHSQQKLVSQLLENLYEGVVACDAEGRLMLFNKSARLWHGADISQVDPTEWAEKYNLFEADGVTPLSAERIPLIQAYEGKVVRDFQLTIVAKDKKPRMVIANGDLLKDSNGQRIGAVVAMHDITQQKKAEQELIENNEHRLHKQKILSDLAKTNFSNLESAFAEIVEKDAQVLKIDRVSIWLFDNDETELICHGLYSEKKYDYSNKSTIRAENFPRYFKELEQADVMLVSDAQNDPRTNELKKDYLFPLSISSMIDVPIRKTGKVVGVICHEHTGPVRIWSSEEEDFARSIADMCVLALESAERSRAEESLRSSEKRFYNLFELAPDAIIMTDMNSIIQLANFQAEQLFVFGREELIGQHLEKIIPELQLDHYVKQKEGLIVETAMPSLDINQSLLAQCKDGSSFPADISLRPLESDNGLQIMVSVRDVSEQMRSKTELSRANEIIEKERGQLALRVEERTLELEEAKLAARRRTWPSLPFWQQ